MNDLIKKVFEIEARVERISGLKDEAKALKRFDREKPVKKVLKPVSLYERPWESIVVKPKSK